jgi:hypothetical protein
MRQIHRVSFVSAFIAIALMGLLAACTTTTATTITSKTSSTPTATTILGSTPSTPTTTPSTPPTTTTKTGTTPSNTPAPSKSTKSSTPFQVTGIGVSAGPNLSGYRCGTTFTESYTATFTLAPGGPGGTILFQYTTNNGRSSSATNSLIVAAGQTTATFVFKWSGMLTVSHTAPGIGMVMLLAPSQMISPAATPPGGVGACSTM